MNEDRPALSAMLHIESTFQRCIYYIDILNVSPLQAPMSHISRLLHATFTF